MNKQNVINFFNTSLHGFKILSIIIGIVLVGFLFLAIAGGALLFLAYIADFIIHMVPWASWILGALLVLFILLMVCYEIGRRDQQY